MTVLINTAEDKASNEKFSRIEVQMSASGDVATVFLPHVPKSQSSSSVNIQVVWGSGTSGLAVAGTLGRNKQLGNGLDIDAASIPWGSLPGGVTALANNTITSVNWPITGLKFTSTGGGASIIILVP